MESKSFYYRRDIDGLRAIAVFFVIIFHVFPKYMKGGFVGVDIFFVISGFLISGIIFDGLHKNKFSIVEFYRRRIRRIFPALIIVFLFCLIAGWFVLLDDEYQKLAKHIVSGVMFLSNIVLWRETGYFDDMVILKPLLHLWSLGVEEQFYIFWPIILRIIWQFRKHAVILLSVMASVSFAINIFFIETDPSAVFFLPITRFWELALGGILAYVMFYSSVDLSNIKVKSMQGIMSRVVDNGIYVKDFFSILGLILIFLSAFLLDKNNNFPGWWGLLPTIGTLMIISVGCNALINKKFLSHPFLIYIGLISFPLYLWHWPLLSLGHIIKADTLSTVERTIIVLVSIMLASLTYHLIEKPIKFSKRNVFSKYSVHCLLGSMVVVFLFASFCYTGTVLPYSAGIPYMSEVAAASKDISYGKDQIMIGTVPNKVLFFGDSHIQHYLPRIKSLMTNQQEVRRTVVFHTSGGCAPIPGIERKKRHCRDFVRRGFEIAKEPLVDTVVIGASWPGFVSRDDYYNTNDKNHTILDFTDVENRWIFKKWSAELKKLTSIGKKVIIILSLPRTDLLNPKKMISRGVMSFEYHPVLVQREKLTLASKFIDDQIRIVAQESGAIILDPLMFFCNKTVCSSTFENNRPISTDGSHLRAAYVSKHLKYLDQFILKKQST